MIVPLVRPVGPQAVVNWISSEEPYMPSVNEAVFAKALVVHWPVAPAKVSVNSVSRYCPCVAELDKAAAAVSQDSTAVQSVPTGYSAATAEEAETEVILPETV